MVYGTPFTCMSFAGHLNGLSAVSLPEQSGADARRLCEHAGEIGMVVDAEAVGNLLY